jgi:hypothetical protein
VNDALILGSFVLLTVAAAAGVLVLIGRTERRL